MVRCLCRRSCGLSNTALPMPLAPRCTDSSPTSALANCDRALQSIGVHSSRNAQANHGSRSDKRCLKSTFVWMSNLPSCSGQASSRRNALPDTAVVWLYQADERNLTRCPILAPDMLIPSQVSRRRHRRSCAFWLPDRGSHVPLLLQQAGLPGLDHRLDRVDGLTGPGLRLVQRLNPNGNDVRQTASHSAVGDRARRQIEMTGR